MREHIEDRLETLPASEQARPVQILQDDHPELTSCSGQRLRRGLRDRAFDDGGRCRSRKCVPSQRIRAIPVPEKVGWVRPFRLAPLCARPLKPGPSRSRPSE